MTSPPQTTLEKAIQKFRDNLTKEQKHQFAIVSGDDVKNQIEQIQDRYGSTKRLRSLGRLSRFVEAMHEIEKLVQIFLNVSEVVAFVWGPVKLMLMVASSKLETLEFLLDTYVEVGELIPHLRQYDQLFKASPSVLEVLERYFEDILQFHQSALKVFSRPGWRTFFDAAWRTFKTEFKPIVESLKRHRALLADERLNAAVLEVQVTRSQTLTAVDKSSAETARAIRLVSQQVDEVYRQISQQMYSIEHKVEESDAKERTAAKLEEVRFLAQKLEPPDYEVDYEGASEQRHLSSGDWFLKEPLFRKWSTSQMLPDTALYVHGMPGAGKTILASKIISHFRDSTSFSSVRCVFFFFKHREDTKQSMASMLRALIVQLLKQDPTLLGASFEKYGSVSNAEVRSLTNLKSCAKKLLQGQKECNIILDGLDECSDNAKLVNGRSVKESTQILDWLLQEIMPASSAHGSTMRLLVTGQRDGILDKHLLKYPTFKLDTAAQHLEDICANTSRLALELQTRFGLEDAERQSIAKQVAAASKGMFLYATVVMGNLLNQGSEMELKQELTVNFPHGLDQAYERVAFRLLDHPTRPRTLKESAAKILRWIACAVRPLKWYEIQSLFCIDALDGTCEPRKRRVDDCKVICGSFVDVEHMKKNDEYSMVVRFVHDTALRFLIDTKRVDLAQENARMAIFSMRYLASSPLQKNRDRQDILHNAISGYYGILDYAIVSWQRHVDDVVKKQDNSSTDLVIDLRTVLESIFEVQSLSIDLCGPSMEHPTESDFLVDGESCRAYTEHLEEQCSFVRKVIESIQPQFLGVSECNGFLALNGSLSFKCPKTQCSMFSDGFPDRKSREQHVKDHDMQFFCLVDSCLRHSLGFTSQKDLGEHTKASHPPETSTQHVFPSSTKKKSDIWSACASGNLSDVKQFAAEGVSLKESKTRFGGLTPIVLAARNAHFPVCEYLVRQGCSIYDDETGALAVTALGEAIQAGSLERFNQFVRLGTEDQRHAFVQGPHLAAHITTAVNFGCREVLGELLSWETTRQDRLELKDILVSACCTDGVNNRAIDNYDCIWSLLDDESKYELLSRTDISLRSYAELCNLLHAACHYDNGSATSLLIQHMTGAQLNQKNNFGQTPLLYGLQRASVPRAVKLLIESSEDIDLAALAYGKKNALHLVCRKDPTDNWVEILRLLLTKRRDLINMRDSGGDTPLHIAVYQGRLEFVAMLLETAECDLAITNGDEKTVFEVGRPSRNYKEEIDKLLHLSQLKEGKK